MPKLPLHLQNAAIRKIICQGSKISICRGLKSHVLRKPPTNNHDKNRRNLPDKKLKLITREALDLSQVQIQKLWNLFGDQASQSSFDVRDFVSRFPNVNVSLTKEFTSNDDLSSSSKYTPVAEEAEQKLEKMLEKIDQHDILPYEIQLKIQNLLRQELETVLDLWLSISETSKFDSLQESIAPIDRAAELLLNFESLHEKGVKLVAKNSNAFYPPAPAIGSYQNVLNYYHHLFSSIEQHQSNFSVEMAQHFQNRSRKLIEGMMKQVWTIRKLEFLQDDFSTSSSVQVSSTLPLRDSYNSAISMHTSPVLFNEDTSLSISGLTKMANASSQLLQEMESYYHDFHTMTKSNDNEHISSDLQSLLLSIYPTRQSFQLVLKMFVRIASEANCKVSITRAARILERINKRYQAYTRTTNSGSADQESDHMFKPDLELYVMVLEGYADVENLGEDEFKRVSKIINDMEEDTDIVVTESILELAQNICQNQTKIK